MSNIFLIKVSDDNNNRYYNMIKLNSQTFVVEYGRFDVTKNRKEYPMSKWDSLIKSKIKKGYKDITHLKGEVSKDSNVDLKVDHSFLKLMMSYRDEMLSSSYTVSMNSVTQNQIDEAQRIIQTLKSTSDPDINDLLCELYSVIPRRMKNVRDFLLPNISISDILQEEQDKLDAVSSAINVSQNSSETYSPNYSLIDHKSFKNDNNLEYIINQLESSDASYRGRVNINSVYKVDKSEERLKLEDWLESSKNKTIKYGIHGTHCKSVIPILEQGLKIRPSGNFSFSGKVYGNGNYFSEKTKKSLNYTNPSDKDKVLLIYKCHLGNPFMYNGRYSGNNFKLEYSELSKRGFDSTFVKAGNGLLNDEMILYNEDQSSIEYLIHLE